MTTLFLLVIPLPFPSLHTTIPTLPLPHSSFLDKAQDHARLFSFDLPRVNDLSEWATRLTILFQENGALPHPPIRVPFQFLPRYIRQAGATRRAC
jgi:hypothetical protein